MRAIEPTASGRFKVRFRHGGRQTSETFDTRREAERFARWLGALGAQGALDQLYEGERAADVPRLNEVAEDHIKHLTKANDGTKLTYRRMWERTWGKHLGHLPVNQVTRDDLARVINIMAATHSQKTIRNHHGLISAVLGRAVEEGWVTKNPAKKMDLPDGSTAHDAAEMRVLTPEEFHRIEERMPEHYRPFVRFLVGSGCRWGEAVALTVADVQLPNVRIRRALKWSPDNHRVVGKPKTRKGNRTVMLGEELGRDLRAACEGKAGTDLVWTAPRGGAILHRTFWSRVWLPAVADLEPRPRIHDLRHTHASWLLSQGIPIYVVQARLGHESIKTTVDTYGHLMPDAQMMAASAAAIGLGTSTPSGLPPSINR